MIEDLEREVGRGSGRERSWVRVADGSQGCSGNHDEIACWFIDTDYNEESFFVRQAYFLGANDPYKSLKPTLRAEINRDAWESLHSGHRPQDHRPGGAAPRGTRPHPDHGNSPSRRSRFSVRFPHSAIAPNTVRP